MSALLERGAARVGLRRGLIGGAVVLLVSLVGMVEAFAKRSIVHELLGPLGAGLPIQLLDLGQVAWIGAVLLSGFAAARELLDHGEDRPPAGPALLAGGITGAVAGAMPALLVLLGTRFDLAEVFDKARPQLYALLSWGLVERGTPSGVDAFLATILMCVLAGVVGAAVHLMPPAHRKALGVGVLTVLVMGTIQDLLQKIDFVERTAWLSGLYDALYTREGMEPLGAALLLAAASGLHLVAPGIRAARERRRGDADAAGDYGDAPPSARERTMRWLGLGGIALLLIWFPFGFGKVPADVMDLVGIYILMGLGLNIVVGFAGLLDLGYVAFFAIGAYTVGILTTTDPDVGLQFGWSLWQALPLVVLFTIVAGVILGVPVLKTHGDYLAIITLGFGEIIRILAISDALKPFMGGAQGITLIPKPFDLPEIPMPFAGNPSEALIGRLNPGIQQEIYFPILFAVIAAAYVSWRLRHSRFGRAWMALREDENIAEAMGINLVSTKLLAFATGAVFAGIGGALFAAKLGSIYPSSFGLLVSINVLVLIIVGGMGSIPGVFVGALAIVGLPELLREFEDFRLLLYGAVLVVMMLKRPEGLWPAAIVQRELQRESDATVLP